MGYKALSLNTVSITRTEFDKLQFKPDNYLFYVLDKTDQNGVVVDTYALYKGRIPVANGDVSIEIPSKGGTNGGFRASAFSLSANKPMKPSESEFPTYRDLVNGKGVWQSRPDSSALDGRYWWISYHWFKGDSANTLDSGDTWTDPVQLTGSIGQKGEKGDPGVNIKGDKGDPGIQGSPGKSGEDGMNVFVRFNPAYEKPAVPTGIGIYDGWSATQESKSRWMSVKQAKTINEGVWGNPVQIKANLYHYNVQTGNIEDELGNVLGAAFSPVYWIDTEQVIVVSIDDQYTLDTSVPLRVICYVGTPMGTRALIGGDDYRLLCKVRDNRDYNAERVFYLPFSNGEWLLQLEDWFSTDRTTDFIELHLYKKNTSDPDNPENPGTALAIKLVQLVRDGEAGKISEVWATTLNPGEEAYAKNHGTLHDARLELGIPQGEKGDKGDRGIAPLLHIDENTGHLIATYDE